ncbi:uncharacterized protein LOC123663967 [Melitaea cinxia]|uniref:uncharacterized protein LOC123663967 n=1 Tax=Melitaea cinxia TaxID=113334 RepID=UPI001E2737A9|nr:uncharacterized protein LOC123663967 [Melitaea cinxia]
MFKCIRCNVEFRDGAQCSVCQERFDFPCAGITEGGYRKLGDRRNSWKCPSCKSTGAPSPHFLPSKKAPGLSPTSADMDSMAMDIKNLTSQLASLPTLMASVKAIQLDIEELKSLKADLTDIKLLRPELSEVKSSLDFIHSSVESLTSRISEISLEVQGLLKTKDDLNQLQQRFDSLDIKIKEMEQRSRLNNIEIKGVPMTASENLFEVLEKLGNYIGFSIPKEQVNHIARIPMRNNEHNKTIIVALHTRNLKEDFVAAAKKSTISSADLGFTANQRIFVNDHLTLENKLLLNKTKNLGREKGFAYIWVKGCKIFARKSPTSHAIIIKSESDLKKKIV